MVGHNLRRIGDVDALNPGDSAVVDEVREVLQRHGASDRFGISLLHRHFELDDDEVLVEFVDTESRTLTSRPVPRSALDEEGLIPTSWRLDDDGADAGALEYCYQPKGGGVHARDLPENTTDHRFAPAVRAAIAFLAHAQDAHGGVEELLDAHGVPHPPLQHTVVGAAEPDVQPSMTICPEGSRAVHETYVDVHGNRHWYWTCV